MPDTDRLDSKNMARPMAVIAAAEGWRFRVGAYAPAKWAVGTAGASFCGAGWQADSTQMASSRAGIVFIMGWQRSNGM